MAADVLEAGCGKYDTEGKVLETRMLERPPS